MNQVKREGIANYRNTDWDALGYYLYTPALLLHGDPAKLEWYTAVDSTYHFQGNSGFYQFSKLTNGNRVGKYFSGVAIMQSPFFLLAHFAAPILGYPADGFSLPYQLAVALAALIYSAITLFLLRRLLLRYFDDSIVAFSLLLTFGASNFLQYVSVDAGQVHIYALFWYAAMLVVSERFYSAPSIRGAALIGFIAGMATLCRPTEAIIILIPIFWGFQTQTVCANRSIILQRKSLWLVAVAAGLITITPQLCYWKHCTGNWVYDVGSKWDFLQPHLKVLWGWEKGWFIYTPVSVLFLIGLFLMKKYPFRRAAQLYFLLNIWIVCAWSDWRYGGGFSARALVQCLPIASLCTAVFVQALSPLFRVVSVLVLVPLNLFQIEQYNRNIIDYQSNNRDYYFSVFGRLHPDVIAYSLLEDNYPEPRQIRYDRYTVVKSSVSVTQVHPLKVPLPPSIEGGVSGYRVDFRLHSLSPVWNRRMIVEIRSGGQSYIAKLRLQQPYFNAQAANAYAVYIPVNSRADSLLIYPEDAEYSGIMHAVTVAAGRLDP
jgi:hypothetical protein